MATKTKSAEAPTATPGARATVRYLRVSPYKVRQVLQLVRGLAVDDAERMLQLCEKDAADDVLKLLDSAISNAEHNYSLPAEELFVARAWCDEGPTRKWGQPRARGRYFRIRKRTSHVTIILERFAPDELEQRQRREESTGRGAATAQRRRAERVRKSRQREERAAAAHDHDHDHEPDKLADALAEDATMAQEEALAAEGEYPGAEVAEPTEGEAEPEATMDVDTVDAAESTDEPDEGKE